MSAAQTLALAAEISLGLLLVALFLTLIRLWRGPTLGDRIMALDLMLVLAVGFIAAFAILTGFTLYIDIAIALGLVGFLSTVALARYLASRGPDGEGDQ
jgi:multicomponent Na+:H+ antiporter subunit F